MSMPFYASAEQIMRDRSEYARKGIARGRSAIVMPYTDGVLFVAENASLSLHKVSEVYDRIAFAAVGKYNEFENLRVAGIRLADLRGYSYDRRDVTARALANAYAQTLGTIFTEQQKPYEVELCVAEIGPEPDDDQLYRISYDGTIVDEPDFLVMGGQADTVAGELRSSFRRGLPLADALQVAVHALASVGGSDDAPRALPAALLEVAVLDRNRAGTRKFKRIVGAALTALLPPAPAEDDDQGESAPVDTPPHDVDGSGEPAADHPGAIGSPAAPPRSSGSSTADASEGVDLPDHTDLGSTGAGDHGLDPEPPSGPAPDLGP